MAEGFKATVLKTVNVIVREFESLYLRKYMNNLKLNQIINKYLNSDYIKDNSVNGIQIEGKKNIKNIYTCVTINNFVIKKAILNKVDTLIAHHGILWKNNFLNIIGIQKKRIHKILLNNINIFAWHLPLDIHPKIGNNVIIAKKLNTNIKILPTNKFPVLLCKLNNNKNIFKKIKKQTRNFYFHQSKKKKINKIGICSGCGEKFLEKSILEYNIDTYITGEISENYFYIFEEYDINIFIIKHYISEIYGIKKLGKWIKKKFKLNVSFLNSFNEYEYILNKK